MPDFKLEKALSVGAKIVIPLLVLLSWPSNWFATCVAFINRIKVENWPAFSRIFVTLVGPGGAGDDAGASTGAAFGATTGAAAGAWAKVNNVEQEVWRRKKSIR